MSKEAMKLALEALEDIGDEWGFTSKRTLPNREKAITALREALAEQPAQQKPVAWTNWRELVGARHYRTPGWEMYADKRNPDDVAIYTSPPAQRKPLTDEEFISMVDSTGLVIDPELAFEIKALVEAAHGIKENT